MPPRSPWKKMREFACFALLLGLLTVSNAAHADGVDRQAGHFLSGTGTIIYLAAGTGLPLLTDGKAGKTHTLRALDSLAMSMLLSQGLKDLTQEKRPDSSNHDSFPSGHATLVFSLATMESAYHPQDAPYWYAGAALISMSRFTLHHHTIGDVLAGAALGYGISRLELSSRRGILLAPFIPPDSRGVGLSVTARF